MADTKHTPAPAAPSNAAKGGKKTRASNVAQRLAARGVTMDVMREKLRSASARDLTIVKLSLGFDADKADWSATGAAPLRAPEIAAHVGCTPEVVRAVRKAFGVIEGTAARMHEGAFDVPQVVDLDDEESTGAEFLEGFGVRDKASQIAAAVVLETPREFKDRQTAREWLRSVGEDPDAVEHGEHRELAGHTAQSLRAVHAAASLMLDARQTLIDAERCAITAQAMDEWFEQFPQALRIVGAEAADLLVSVDVCVEHGAALQALTARMTEAETLDAVDVIVADMAQRLRTRGAAAATVLDDAGLSPEQARAEQARLIAEFDAAFEQAREIEAAAGLQCPWINTPEGREIAAGMTFDSDESDREFAASWHPQGTATVGTSKRRRRTLSASDVHATVERIAVGAAGGVSVRLSSTTAQAVD